MMRPILKGSTDQSVVIRIVDSTDGTPETGVVFNTSGIDLWYRREGATRTSITEATLSALNDAHSDGGILHIGDGYYRLDLPDAAFATGANGVMVGGTVTGMVVIGCYVPLFDVNPYDAVRMGMTALPNAAAEAAGGLYTRGSGAGQINQPANGLIDANVLRFGGTAGTFASGRPEVNTTHVGGTAQTAGDIPARLPAALVGGRMDSNMGAISADATAADNLEAALDGTGGVTITAALTGNVTGNLSGSVGSVTGNVGGNVAGSVGSVTGAVGSVTGNVGGNVAGSVGSVTAEVTPTAASKTGYRLSATGVDDLLDEVVLGSYTMRQLLRGIAAMGLGKLSGAATTTITIRSADDTKDVVVATVDADGNRSAVTLDLA